MKKWLLILILVPVTIWSQNIPFVSGARSTGLGGGAMVVSDVWSVNANQAALGFLNAPEVGLYYTNRFMLKELSSQSLSFVMPTKLGNWGLSVERFGYSEYSEMQLGLAYAKVLNPYVSLGLKFDYLQIFQPESYGNARAVLAEFGIFAKPYENILVSAHVYNPTLSKFNTLSEQKAPAILSLAIGYKIDKSVLLLVQTDKNYLTDVIYKMGVEMNIKENLYLRAGVNIHPNAYAFGIAYYLKNIKIDLSFSYQQVLGMSHGSSLGYVFNNAKR